MRIQIETNVRPIINYLLAFVVALIIILISDYIKEPLTVALLQK